MMCGMRTVKATNLSPRPGHADSLLADGSFVFAVSIQREWVYVRALRMDGKFVRRRYRHDQQVPMRS